MVDPNDQPLFPAPTTTPDTTPTEAPPLCSLCRLRPAKWGPRMNDWTRYCGSGHCSNHLRKCIHCGVVLPLAEFRYVKYCSDDCTKEVHADRESARYAGSHTCLQCGNTSVSSKAAPHGWRDGRCSNCWRTHVGNDRMKAMQLHNVPWDDADRWAQSGWLCDLCYEPVSIRAGVVDHDHTCCPGSRSCGKCVRGYLHSNCNVAIGYLKNDPVLLRAGADYLERYEARR